MESASGGKVQRLVCEFCLDARDKLWLRRTLDCRVLAPERKARGEAQAQQGEAEEESKRGEGRGGRARPRSRAGEEEGGWGSDGGEDWEGERVLPWLPPPPSMVLPGHRIEERIGRRASRREVAVDEVEVARILGQAGNSGSSSSLMGV